MKKRSPHVAALIALGFVLAPALASAQASALDPEITGAGEDPSATATDRRAAADVGLAAGQLSGPVNPETYRLGPGDRLLLHIRGQVSRDVRIDVDPEGNVLIPDVGLTFVSGRTLAEVRTDILQRVRRTYRSIELQLRLVRPRTFRVYLTGQVASPGPVLANGSFRVADVLTPAMLEDGASRRNIEVIHTDRTSSPCDLELFLQTGEATWNPWLRDGDVIQVPTATRFVHAEGALARPGRYELGQSDSLRKILRLAGDPLPSASLERMLVVRFADSATPESLWVSVSDVLESRTDLRLGDGERFYVYFVPRYRELRQVSILGEVRRPGVYPIVEGQTSLKDLVESAGGFLASADLNKIRVHRAATLASAKDPEMERLLRLSRTELTASEYEILRTRLAGMREDYTVDWSRLEDHAELDLLLRDGDVVRVDQPGLSVRVDGEVQRPGLLNYVRGQSVSDYIEQAGGFTNRAWRGKVRVTRAITGQTLLARDVRSLDPGDFVWTPERPDITQWDRFKDVLVTLSQVATIVIAIRSVR